MMGYNIIYGLCTSVFEIFKKIPDSAGYELAINYYSGIAYIETNNFDKAIECFEFFTNSGLNDRTEIARWYLALCYLKTNNIGKVIEQFKLIVEEGTGYYNESMLDILKDIDK